MKTETLYMSGIGEREKFDNLILVLNQDQIMELFYRLSNSVYHNNHTHTFAIFVNGQFYDGDAANSNRFIKIR